MNDNLRALVKKVLDDAYVKVNETVNTAFQEANNLVDVVLPESKWSEPEPFPEVPKSTYRQYHDLYNKAQQLGLNNIADKIQQLYTASQNGTVPNEAIKANLDSVARIVDIIAKATEALGKRGGTDEGPYDKP